MTPASSHLPEINSFLRRGKTVAKVRVPLFKDLPGSLRETALGLPAISGSWNPVEIYTAEPKSRREEQQKFLYAFHRDRVYNPKFSYDYAEEFTLGDSRERLGALLEKVRLFQPGERVEKIVRWMLFHKIKDDLATCDLVEGIQQKDEARIGQALQYKYPGVDPVILELAEDDWQNRTAEGVQREAPLHGSLTNDEKKYLRQLTFDAEAMKEAFEWALDRYGILASANKPRGFKVKVDRRATAIDVRDKSVHGPTVFIPEQTRENGEKLLALMAHEIEGHARQSWNGEQFFIFGGGPLKIDDETLYEGLAMRYEHAFSWKYFGRESMHRNLDYYVFAVHMAERGASFHDVFVDQLERRLRVVLNIPRSATFSHTQVRHAPMYEQAEQSAWGTTYRIMRGHVDMQNPLSFGMAKDLAYFRGWMLDHQLRESGHGHINEAAISSIGQLRVLAEFDIVEKDLPCPFRDVTSEYLKVLLEQRTEGNAFSAKKR
jgi:hypothetical protein